MNRKDSSQRLVKGQNKPITNVFSLLIFFQIPIWRLTWCHVSPRWFCTLPIWRTWQNFRMIPQIRQFFESKEREVKIPPIYSVCENIPQLLKLWDRCFVFLFSPFAFVVVRLWHVVCNSFCFSCVSCFQKVLNRGRTAICSSWE